MVIDVPEKSGRFEATVFPAAFLTVFKISFITCVSLVAFDGAVVEQHGSAFDLVLDGVVGTMQTSGDFVDRPLILV